MLFRSEISQSTQVKLLRFLETKSIERVGGAKPIELDVRLVAATNRHLEQMVRDGKFREDLFFRLNVVRLTMPPLRERAEDIPLLLAHFIKVFADENGTPLLTVEPGASQTLQRYAWPGNIRELRNFCENAVVLRRGGSLTEYDLEPKFRGGVAAASSSASHAAAPAANPLSVEENEKRLLREAFRLEQRAMPAGVDLIVQVRPHEPRELATYRTALLEHAPTLGALALREPDRDPSRPTGGSAAGDAR